MPDWAIEHAQLISDGAFALLAALSRSFLAAQAANVATGPQQPTLAIMLRVIIEQFKSVQDTAGSRRSTSALVAYPQGPGAAQEERKG